LIKGKIKIIIKSLIVIALSCGMVSCVAKKAVKVSAAGAKAGAKATVCGARAGAKGVGSLTGLSRDSDKKKDFGRDSDRKKR